MAVGDNRLRAHQLSTGARATKKSDAIIVNTANPAKMKTTCQKWRGEVSCEGEGSMTRRTLTLCQGPVCGGADSSVHGRARCARRTGQVGEADGPGGAGEAAGGGWEG